jgi:beta-lactamase regulating signal transducer with metallopeptidase domain
MSPLSTFAAAWLLTYALHSTLLLGAAAVLTWRWVRGESWREALWKAALVGGVVTATAQVLTDYSSLAGRVAVAGVTQSPPRPMDALPPAAGDPVSADVPPPPNPAPGTPVPAARTEDQVAGSIAPPAEDAVLPRRASLAALAVVAWALIATALLVRLALRQERLRRMLRDRASVADGELAGAVAEMRRNAGLWRPVRLSACEAAPTPLALGGGEICVPPRFLRDLDPEQQRTALAHELAHLARRDPAWHFGIGILESVFFFQPLNRVARLRLRESAEFLCDAWAARQTGSPLGLARCLAEVASWVAPGRAPIPAGTMAMAEGGSPLVQRVQRLTAWRGEGPQGSGTMRVAAAVALVSVVAAVAPAVARTNGTDRTEAPEPGFASPSASESARIVAPAKDEDGQQVTIIRHPDPGQPLARRWAWAVDEIERRGRARAWVAWSVPTLLTPGVTWITDSGDFRIGEMGRAPLNHVLNAPVEHALLLFAVARGGAVERVAGRSAAGFDLGGLPVVWLGPAEGAQSFAELRRMADGERDTDRRESLVEAAGLHRGEATVPYLAAVLGRDGSNGVRREAAQALGHHPTAEALAALRTAVVRDGSDDVRREAVEAIGRMGTAQSSAVLERLALGAANEGVRRQAAESIGQQPGGRGIETLGAIALNDRSADVAREAVEAMARYPARVATPLLVRIAWTGDHPEAARQAAETLGRLPAPWAVVPLDSIARRHPNASVAQQAVESLGGYSDAVAGEYLRQIARSHPNPRISEEAADYLPGGRRAGMDRDPGPELDSAHDPDPDPDEDPDPNPAVP